MNPNDTIDLGDTNLASVYRSLNLSDKARLHGVYHGVVTGPVEHLRSEYVALQGKINALGGADSFHPGVDALVAQLASIPIEVKSSSFAPNLVTDVGAQYALDRALNPSPATSTLYLGLVGKVGNTAPTFSNGDTMSSHSGWVEDALYSEATRPTPSWSAAAGRSKSTSAGVVFTSSAGAGVTDVVTGCFLVTEGTKSGSGGTLFSVGAFTGGDQPLVVGNVLTVTYTLSC